MATKLTRDQLEAMYSGPDSDRPSVALLARRLHRNASGLRQLMWRMGIEMRSASEQKHIDLDAKRFTTPNVTKRLISREALHALYYKRGLSFNDMSNLISVSPSSVKNWFRTEGIPSRSLSAAYQLLVEKGDWKPYALTEEQKANRLESGARWRKENPERFAELLKRAQSAPKKAYLNGSRRRMFVCAWCGKQKERSLHRLKFDWHACSRVCGNHYRGFRCKKGSPLPRPLILDRLRELMQTTPHRDMPHDYGHVVLAGKTIGAGLVEYAAYWADWYENLISQQQEAPVVVVREALRPRRPRTIKSEKVGAVGEALLRAQREAEAAD